ncbi:MAG TPA: neutral zinc metallopeptidase, partial [Amycolatopsis sp.]|nr:neutral zinc metallopeptidase [Amycolatopsis sp.]
RAVRKTKDNPLLTDSSTGLPNAPCKLARWGNTPQASRAFFESARPCLDRVWQTALDDAGLPFEVPSLAFPTGTQWSSPCGNSSNGNVAAFYCGRNQTLYMPFDGLQVPQYGAHPGVYLAVFAHEYGHHAQQMSGIMETYWEQRYDAGTDSPAGLELSRRNELMAQCFSGMFLGSTVNRGGDVDDNIYREAWQSEDRGDRSGPRDHGSIDHYISWWQQGATKNRFAQCNTYNTSPGNVS